MNLASRVLRSTTRVRSEGPCGTDRNRHACPPILRDADDMRAEPFVSVLGFSLIGDAHRQHVHFKSSPGEKGTGVERTNLIAPKGRPLGENGHRCAMLELRSNRANGCGAARVSIPLDEKCPDASRGNPENRPPRKIGAAQHEAPEKPEENHNIERGPVVADHQARAMAMKSMFGLTSNMHLEAQDAARQCEVALPPTLHFIPARALWKQKCTQFERADETRGQTRRGHRPRGRSERRENHGWMRARR